MQAQQGRYDPVFYDLLQGKLEPKAVTSKNLYKKPRRSMYSSLFNHIFQKHFLNDKALWRCEMCKCSLIYWDDFLGCRVVQFLYKYERCGET